MPTIKSQRGLRRNLLAWYDANRRDLPWRKTRDPYRVWVSEIMLQQTRVAAVLPRYEKFLQTFPSLHQLAAARESSVLAEWSGLGYYRRARNIHAAAKIIAKALAGEFPQTSNAWRQLPGIGRYTAAAIASIAFHEPIAVLDGNVERVIRRLCNVRNAAAAWRIADTLLDRSRPGDFNQAMMELGALLCLPQRPACEACPIRKFCRTRGKGDSVRRKQSRQKRQVDYALVRSGDSLRLVQRPSDNASMPGMWDLPEANPSPTPDELLFKLRHSIMVTDYIVRVVTRSAAMPDSGTWVPISRIKKMPLTGLAKKILRRAQII